MKGLHVADTVHKCTAAGKVKVVVRNNSNNNNNNQGKLR